MGRRHEADRLLATILRNSHETFRFCKSERFDTDDDKVVELELQSPGRFDYRWNMGGLPWQELEGSWSFLSRLQ